MEQLGLFGIYLLFVTLKFAISMRLTKDVKFDFLIRFGLYKKSFVRQTHSKVGAGLDKGLSWHGDIVLFAELFEVLFLSKSALETFGVFTGLQRLVKLLDTACCSF